MLELEEVKTLQEKSVQYEGLSNKILNSLRKSTEEFMNIGYCLNEIHKNKLYELEGYADVYEYANDVFKLSKTTTSNFINCFLKFGFIPEGYCYRGFEIKEPFKDFSMSQLIELLPVPEDEIDSFKADMTVKEIRANKTLIKLDEKIIPLKEGFIKIIKCMREFIVNNLSLPNLDVDKDNFTISDIRLVEVSTKYNMFDMKYMCHINIDNSFYSNLSGVELRCYSYFSNLKDVSCCIDFVVKNDRYSFLSCSGDFDLEFIDELTFDYFSTKERFNKLVSSGVHDYFVRKNHVKQEEKKVEEELNANVPMTFEEAANSNFGLADELKDTSSSLFEELTYFFKDYEKSKRKCIFFVIDYRWSDLVFFFPESKIGLRFDSRGYVGLVNINNDYTVIDIDDIDIIKSIFSAGLFSKFYDNLILSLDSQNEEDEDVED